MYLQVVFLFGFCGSDLELLVNVRRQVVKRAAEVEFGQGKGVGVELVSLLYERGALGGVVKVQLAYDCFFPGSGGEVALGTLGGRELEQQAVRFVLYRVASLIFHLSRPFARRARPR